VTRQRIGTTYCWNSLVVTLGLLSGCATQLQVGSDYDRTATFRDYHTFTVMRREHSGLENPLNPLVAARVEDAIRADLNEKGYVEAGDPQAADLLSPSQSAPESGPTLPLPATVRGWVGLGQDRGAGRTGATLWMCASIERGPCH